jgi:hypothetical protein
MTSDFDDRVPVVDTVQQLTGGMCTIYQRMNDQGDMLIIASTVKDADGRRSVGSYLPFTLPDGTSHPMITTVLNDTIYRTQTLEGKQRYQSIYKAIKDPDGRILGIISLGEKELANSDLIDAIFSARIGTNGYPAVIDSKGVIILHPTSEFIGKNIVSELGIAELNQVMRNYASKESELISYSFQGQQRFLVHTYFEAWDWIILATGDWKDFAQITNARQALINEMQKMVRNIPVMIADLNIPLYCQIRYIDENGKTDVALQTRPISDMPESENGLIEIGSVKRMNKNAVVNHGVLNELEKTVMRVASPVILDNTFKGAVVIDFNWDVIWELLRNKTYGKTGYPYIIDDKGVSDQPSQI